MHLGSGRPFIHALLLGQRVGQLLLPRAVALAGDHPAGSARDLGGPRPFHPPVPAPRYGQSRLHPGARQACCQPRQIFVRLLGYGADV